MAESLLLKIIICEISLALGVGLGIGVTIAGAYFINQS
jgi:hypothetical protein